MVVDLELKKKRIQLKAMHGPRVLSSLFLLNSKALKANWLVLMAFAVFVFLVLELME